MVITVPSVNLLNLTRSPIASGDGPTIRYCLGFLFDLGWIKKSE